MCDPVLGPILLGVGARMFVNWMNQPPAEPEPKPQVIERRIDRVRVGGRVYEREEIRETRPTPR